MKELHIHAAAGTDCRLFWEVIHWYFCMPLGSWVTEQCHVDDTFLVEVNASYTKDIHGELVKFDPYDDPDTYQEFQALLSAMLLEKV